MAKALIAAVSLAVVLVAAVVVPLVFLPGAFGFSDWPEATPSAPREQVVTLEVPARKTVVVEHKRHAPVAPKPVATPTQRLAQATPPPTAVSGSEQPQQRDEPAAPAEPLAAPEAQPEPIAIDARGDVAHDLGLDGTNLP